MRAVIEPHRFSGIFRVPASKSHTIRRLLIAALAEHPRGFPGEGISEIAYPLDSLDTRSCAEACRSLGAVIEEYYAADPDCPNPADADGNKLVRWRVRGAGIQSGASAAAINVGNSGTTLYLGMAAAALGTRPVEFDGDEQIRRRSAAPLLEALKGLGVRALSKHNNGCAPVTICGPWKGGRVSLACPTSQYLSAILMAAPMAPAGAVTEIDVPLLNERPYIEMTLSYLDAQGIPYETNADFSWFRIPGGSAWKPVNGPVPGDFSSAAFPGCAAAVTAAAVTLLGLDPEDTQGDKAVFTMLEKMGCTVRWERAAEWRLTISRSGPLRGGEFDLNATPDLLPVMAVTACFCEGDTALVNAAHARLKETDRIAAMAAELGKLGVKTEERPDGLIIHGRGGLAGPALRGGKADGRGDHRIVMALAAGALGAAGAVEIDQAECAAVTYPGFLDLLTTNA